MSRPVAICLAALAVIAACGRPKPLSPSADGSQGATDGYATDGVLESLPDAVIQGEDAAAVSDAVLEAFERLPSMIGVVVCPGESAGQFGYAFDVTSCCTPPDS